MMLDKQYTIDLTIFAEEGTRLNDYVVEESIREALWMLPYSLSFKITEVSDASAS